MTEYEYGIKLQILFIGFFSSASDLAVLLDVYGIFLTILIACFLLFQHGGKPDESSQNDNNKNIEPAIPPPPRVYTSNHDNTYTIHVSHSQGICINF